jgi:sugar phosphate isomerase/epimerase
MLGPDDLVLCAGTLLQAPLVERVPAARAAGFAAISLWPHDYQQARAEGRSDADLRALLAHHGVAIAEIDGLSQWLPGDEGAALFGGGEEELYAIAGALGARSLNVVHLTGDPVDPARAAGAFAGVCDRAREHGLLVHLEFLPWSGIGDLGRAAEIVGLAGRANGGLLLDTWHHLRSGNDAAALGRVPGERIFAVQLGDAPLTAEDDVLAETMARRLLPGEGEGDLAGLVRRLDALGCRAPIGVEVFSEALRALPPEEAAQRAGRATREVLAEARSTASEERKGHRA